MLTASEENEMKSIYLKSVLAFIFVGVMAMIVCIPFYIVYLAQQPCNTRTTDRDFTGNSLCSRSISGDT